MEGFLNLRLRPWLRRLITRAIAIVPAVIVAALYGTKGTARLLLLSQVILSLRLFLRCCSAGSVYERTPENGQVHLAVWLKTLAWGTAALIICLNTKYLSDWLGITDWITQK